MGVVSVLWGADPESGLPGEGGINQDLPRSKPANVMVGLQCN
jgi:hypothetical protein